LRAAVEAALKEKIDISLDMSAKADADQITISVKAQGLKKFPPNVRLQIVLAEDRVEYVGGNGVRVHEMVARGMPGGAGGAAPMQGVLSFTGTVDIARLKKQLLSQLNEAEHEAEARFDARPLDLKAFHVVAFLQSSETGEVYQACAIPVSGSAIPAAGTKPGGN
jgi:hypothetical protein